MYGFPMSIGLGGTGAPGVPGYGYTYNNLGVNAPGDVTTKYGMYMSEASPGYYGPGSSGYYCGPQWNGVQLGVSFGFPSISHDAAMTTYAKDLAFEQNLDNTFIGFPGIGIGSAGISFPTITSNRSQLKFAESVRFSYATESDRVNYGGGYTMPVGLGLGYTSAYVGGTIPGAYGMPYYFGLPY
jgi:hypothetical protein